MKKTLSAILLIILVATAPANASVFGEEEIVDVTLRGDVKAVNQLLLQGISANTRNSNGTPVMVLAASVGATRIIASLIENKGSLRLTDKLGNTAVITAATHGHLDSLEFLVKAKAKIQEENSQGQTALMKASENGHLEIVQFLIEHGADHTRSDYTGNLAIDYAKSGRQRVVQTYLKSLN